MVCGVVFCGYAQSEISIDSTNIQHPKGKNRWIIGVELPVFSIASGGKAGLATVTFIYGKQKTERFFLGMAYRHRCILIGEKMMVFVGVRV